MGVSRGEFEGGCEGLLCSQGMMLGIPFSRGLERTAMSRNGSVRGLRE
jgi:hypothetical protein